MVQTFSKNEYWLIVEALEQARNSITEQEQSETWDEKTDEEKCELQDRKNLFMDLLEKLDNFDASDDFNLVVVQELKRLVEKQKTFLKKTYSRTELSF